MVICVGGGGGGERNVNGGGGGSSGLCSMRFCHHDRIRQRDDKLYGGAWRLRIPQEAEAVILFLIAVQWTGQRWCSRWKIKIVNPGGRESRRRERPTRRAENG